MKKLYLLIVLVLAVTGCAQPTEKKPNENDSGSYGVVSAATPEASKTAIEIMNMGGNAVDAAIAVSFTLGVTEPAMSGLGGGTQVLLALPGEKPIAINGATLSPMGTPSKANSGDLKYHRRSTVPSTVKVMDYIYRNYGSGKISWQQLLEPAIKYATDGFTIGKFRHKVYRGYQSQLQESPYNTSFFLMPDGNIPAPGDTLRQPVLASTLRRLAKFGADDFYHGKIASQIDQDMKLNGGWISLADLQNFPDPQELEPVHTNFRGYDVYSQPPPCGGWTALLMLNVLAQQEAHLLQPDTKSRFDHILAAAHLSHAERKKNPIRTITDIEERLTPDYAIALLSALPVTGEATESETGGETTHYSIVDKHGMAVAVTSSINAYFGAAAASPELGFLYNTYMNDFEIGTSLDHPFAIGPSRMNYSSMSPTIVQKDQVTELIIGSPGSARIISSVAQLIQLWADTDMNIEEIVACKRLHSVNNKVYYEDMSTPADWLQEWREKGFEIAFPSYYLSYNDLNAYFGGVHAISRKNGSWQGASDPRRDGVSLKTR